MCVCVCVCVCVCGSVSVNVLDVHPCIYAEYVKFPLVN